LCTEVSKKADSSKEFLEEVQKLQEKYAARNKMPHPEGEEPHGEPLKDPLVRNNKSVDRGQRLKRQSEKNASKKKTNKKK
jgi:hypothetical protein